MTCFRPAKFGPCACERKMGNDFYFLPTNRCLYESDGPQRVSSEKDKRHWIEGGLRVLAIIFFLLGLSLILASCAGSKRVPDLGWPDGNGNQADPYIRDED